MKNEGNIDIKSLVDTSHGVAKIKTIEQANLQHFLTEPIHNKDSWNREYLQLIFRTLSATFFNFTVMNSSYIFQSERLGFREWQDADIPVFAALNADPVVMEHFPRVLSYNETKSVVARFRDHFNEHKYCFYAVDRLDTGSFIGFIGLNHPSFNAWFTPCLEIGWRLLQSEWGQGYATEGALRCLQYAFEVLNAKEVWSFTAVINKRSERVMQKAGMKKTGEFLHPALPTGHRLQQHVLYRKTVDDAIVV